MLPAPKANAYLNASNTYLGVTVHVSEDLVNLIFKTTVQHLVSLVKNKHLDTLRLQMLRKTHFLQNNTIKAFLGIFKSVANNTLNPNLSFMDSPQSEVL